MGNTSSSSKSIDKAQSDFISMYLSLDKELLTTGKMMKLFDTIMGTAPFNEYSPGSLKVEFRNTRGRIYLLFHEFNPHNVNDEQLQNMKNALEILKEIKTTLLDKVIATVKAAKNSEAQTPSYALSDGVQALIGELSKLGATTNQPIYPKEVTSFVEQYDQKKAGLLSNLPAEIVGNIVAPEKGGHLSYRELWDLRSGSTLFSNAITHDRLKKEFEETYDVFYWVVSPPDDSKEQFAPFLGEDINRTEVTEERKRALKELLENLKQSGSPDIVAKMMLATIQKASSNQLYSFDSANVYILMRAELLLYRNLNDFPLLHNHTTAGCAWGPSSLKIVFKVVMEKRPTAEKHLSYQHPNRSKGTVLKEIIGHDQGVVKIPEQPLFKAASLVDVSICISGVNTILASELLKESPSEENTIAP